MKTQRLLLKGISVIIILLLFCLRCGRESEIQVVGTIPIPTRDPVLELTFGDKDLPDEYLIASPNSFAVDDSGRVFVVDEDFVKVYTSNGQPVTMFGGSGQGPGETEMAVQIWLSPNGYISVSGSQFGMTASFFKPDFSFIERKNYIFWQPYKQIIAERGLRLAGTLEAVYCLGESEWLHIVNASSIDRDSERPEEVFIIYETADSVRILANYIKSYPTNIDVTIAKELAAFLVKLLPGNRLVYIHTYHDSRINEEGATYTLTFLSLDTFEKSTLIHTYTPVEFDWQPGIIVGDLKQTNPRLYQRVQERKRLTEKVIAERKFRSPLRSLFVDGNTIFAATFLETKPGMVLTDVFDGSREEYIHSVSLPDTLYWLDVSPIIVNSSMYRLNGSPYTISGENVIIGFPRIEKYRIDPAVYGK